MRNELDMLMIDSEAQGERISNLEYMMQAEEQQRMQTENRVRMAEERVGAVDQQLGELMEILIHFLED